MNDDTRERYGELRRIQRESGLSPTELGVRFLLADPSFASVIPGAANVALLKQNLSCSWSGPLPEELRRKLDAVEKVFPGTIR